MCRFYKKEIGNTDRALFCNSVMQLIYDKHNKIISIEMLSEIKEMYEHFTEYVRNIYELEDSSIPLIHYQRLIELGKDNWGITDEEYQEELAITLLAIKEYHELY